MAKKPVVISMNYDVEPDADTPPDRRYLKFRLRRESDGKLRPGSLAAASATEGDPCLLAIESGSARYIGGSIEFYAQLSGKALKVFEGRAGSIEGMANRTYPIKIGAKLEREGKPDREIDVDAAIKVNLNRMRWRWQRWEADRDERGRRKDERAAEATWYEDSAIEVPLDGERGFRLELRVERWKDGGYVEEKGEYTHWLSPDHTLDRSVLDVDPLPWSKKATDQRVTTWWSVVKHENHEIHKMLPFETTMRVQAYEKGDIEDRGIDKETGRPRLRFSKDAAEPIAIRAIPLLLGEFGVDAEMEKPEEQPFELEGGLIGKRYSLPFDFHVPDHEGKFGPWIPPYKPDGGGGGGGGDGGSGDKSSPGREPSVALTGAPPFELEFYKTPFFCGIPEGAPLPDAGHTAEEYFEKPVRPWQVTLDTPEERGGYKELVKTGGEIHLYAWTESEFVGEREVPIRDGVWQTPGASEEEQSAAAGSGETDQKKGIEMVVRYTYSGKSVRGKAYGNKIVHWSVRDTELPDRGEILIGEAHRVPGEPTGRIALGSGAKGKWKTDDEGRVSLTLYLPELSGKKSGQSKGETLGSWLDDKERKVFVIEIPPPEFGAFAGPTLPMKLERDFEIDPLVEERLALIQSKARGLAGKLKGELAKPAEEFSVDTVKYAAEKFRDKLEENLESIVATLNGIPYFLGYTGVSFGGFHKALNLHKQVYENILALLTDCYFETMFLVGEKLVGKYMSGGDAALDEVAEKGRKAFRKQVTTEVSEQVEKGLKEIEVKVAKATTLRNQAKEVAEEALELSRRADELLEAARRELQDLADEVGNLDEVLQRELTKLRHEVDEAGQALTKHLDDLASKRNRLTQAIPGEESSLRRELDSVSKEIRDAEAKIGKHQSYEESLPELKQKRNAAADTKAELEGEIAALESAKQDIERFQTSFEPKNADLGGKKGRLAGMKEKMAELEASIPNLKDQVSEAKRAFDASATGPESDRLGLELTSLENQLRRNREQLGKLEGELPDLKAEAGALEGELDELQKLKTEADKVISKADEPGLRTRVGELEGELGQLDGNIDRVTDELPQLRTEAEAAGARIEGELAPQKFEAETGLEELAAEAESLKRELAVADDATKGMEEGVDRAKRAVTDRENSPEAERLKRLQKEEFPKLSKKVDGLRTKGMSAGERHSAALGKQQESRADLKKLKGLRGLARSATNRAKRLAETADNLTDKQIREKWQRIVRDQEKFMKEGAEEAAEALNAEAREEYEHAIRYLTGLKNSLEASVTKDGERRLPSLIAAKIYDLAGKTRREQLDNITKRLAYLKSNQAIAPGDMRVDPESQAFFTAAWEGAQWVIKDQYAYYNAKLEKFNEAANSPKIREAAKKAGADTRQLGWFAQKWEDFKSGMGRAWNWGGDQTSKARTTVSGAWKSASETEIGKVVGDARDYTADSRIGRAGIYVAEKLGEGVSLLLEWLWSSIFLPLWKWLIGWAIAGFTKVSHLLNGWFMKGFYDEESLLALFGATLRNFDSDSRERSRTMLSTKKVFDLESLDSDHAAELLLKAAEESSLEVAAKNLQGKSKETAVTAHVNKYERAFQSYHEGRLENFRSGGLKIATLCLDTQFFEAEGREVEARKRAMDPDQGMLALFKEVSQDMENELLEYASKKEYKSLIDGMTEELEFKVNGYRSWKEMEVKLDWFAFTAEWGIRIGAMTGIMVGAGAAYASAGWLAGPALAAGTFGFAVSELLDVLLAKISLLVRVIFVANGALPVALRAETNIVLGEGMAFLALFEGKPLPKVEASSCD